MVRRGVRRAGTLAAVLLAVEFLDELAFAVREAGWPMLRDDLALSYGEVGLLMGVPALTAALAEPLIGLAGDAWRRDVLVAGGGVVFGAAWVMAGLSPTFAVLLVAFIVLYPASGAFVSLGQATLIDRDPGDSERTMARWTLAGSLGVVAGPLLLGLAALLGLGWRGAFAFCGALGLSLAAVSWRRLPRGRHGAGRPGFGAAVREAGGALRRRATWRWLTLLAFSDLLLDVLLGFLALYFVDVAGTSAREAALAVLTWSVVGLAGDALLLPLLVRMRGLVYLRWSASLALVVYPALLLAPWLPAKFVLVAAIGLLNAGWYSILKAQLYDSLPGKSGAVMAIDSGFGVVTGLLPAGLGLLAATAGLEAAMWVLAAGPAALVIGLAGPGKAPAPRA